VDTVAAKKKPGGDVILTGAALWLLSLLVLWVQYGFAAGVFGLLASFGALLVLVSLEVRS